MQLGELTDAALISFIKDKCHDERCFVAEIVAYLAEVEKRYLHRELGSPSLYSFCLHKLGMSEGMAFRRMTAARLVREFPSLLPRIADGRLHLCGLVLLKPYFTEENVEELADAASRLSETRIKLLLAERYPVADVPEVVRPVPSTPGQVPLTVQTNPGSLASIPPAPQAPSSRTKPLSAASYLVQLTISTETHAKLIRARDLMSHRESDRNLASVVDRALDALLERLERERLGRAKRPRKDAPSLADPADISRAARRAVFERDGEQCTFRGPDGERCPEKAFLQLDHVAMRTFGGDGQPANLRVVCGAHNRHLARTMLGESHVPKRRRGQQAVAADPGPVETREVIESEVAMPSCSTPGESRAREEVNTIEPPPMGSCTAGEQSTPDHGDAPAASESSEIDPVSPGRTKAPGHDEPMVGPKRITAAAVDSHDTSGAECARVRSEDLRRPRSNDAPGSTDEDRAVYGLTHMGFRRPSCVRVVREILDRRDTSLSLSSLLHEAIGTLAAGR